MRPFNLNYIWKPPSQSELTPYYISLGLTQLGSVFPYYFHQIFYVECIYFLIFPEVRLCGMGSIKNKFVINNVISIF